MNDKTGTRETDPKEKANPMAELVEQAARNCEQAFRSGLKLQREAGQWWSSWLDRAASTQDWQKQVANLTTTATGLIPATQKRLEEVLDVMAKNTRTGTELLKKAVEAAQTPGIANSQAKWNEVWKGSLEAVRSNAEAAVQIGGRAIDSWIEFAEKNSETAQSRAKAA